MNKETTFKTKQLSKTEASEMHVAPQIFSMAVVAVYCGMDMGWISAMSSAVLIRQREPACHSAVSSDHLTKLHNLPRYVLPENFKFDIHGYLELNLVELYCY